MDQLKDIENHVAGGAERVSSAYVPPLQRTNGQPPPVAANGGLSYMSFDRGGDAGTAAATEAALRQLAEGQGQALSEMLDNAPAGPIKTKWGIGFRSYSECLEYIRANKIEAPEGGVALPLHYTVYEQPSYSIVPSNALWRDPARAAQAKALREEEQGIGRRCLYFPQVLRDARRAVLFEFRRDVFGVLLVTLKDFQAGSEQVLELWIGSGRNERVLQRTVDCLVVGDLVVDVGLVERGAAELGKFRSFLGRLLGERFAGVVIFRRDVELFHQSQCLLVHRLVIALHVCRERHHVLVLAFLQRQLCGCDVELTCRISDVSDLRVGRFRALR